MDLERLRCLQLIDESSSVFTSLLKDLELQKWNRSMTEIISTAGRTGSPWLFELVFWRDRVNWYFHHGKSTG